MAEIYSDCSTGEIITTSCSVVVRVITCYAFILKENTSGEMSHIFQVRCPVTQQHEDTEEVKRVRKVSNWLHPFLVCK